jgi:hypothetical protein
VKAGHQFVIIPEKLIFFGFCLAECSRERSNLSWSSSHLFHSKLFCITVFTRFPHSTYLRQVHYADRQITINMHFKRPQPPSILQQPCRPFTVGGKFTKLAETALPFNEGLGSNVSHSASHTLDLSSSLRPYKSSSCIAQLHISKSFPWDILRHPRHSVSCLLQDHTWWRLAVGVRSLDLLS